MLCHASNRMSAGTATACHSLRLFTQYLINLQNLDGSAAVLSSHPEADTVHYAI